MLNKKNFNTSQSIENNIKNMVNNLAILPSFLKSAMLMPN